MKLARGSRYTVYASVYHIPPPERRLKAPEIAVFDQKGRLVLVTGGGTVGEYSGRFTKSEARSVIASYLNVLHGDFFAAGDIRIVPNEEVQRLVKRGRRGGFHVFIHAEDVPNEKSLYLKAIFLLELGNRVWPESKTIDIVRTQGNEDENGLKQLISKHLQKTRKYYVEPQEIHFITERQRAKYEALTA